MTTIKARDYQIEAIQALEAGRTEGKRRQLVALPTGSGKTIVAALDIREILESELGGALFVAHRDELINQAADKIRTVWPEATIGRVKAENNEVGRQVTVASIQTIHRDHRLQDLLSHPYSVLYVDEAHHAAAPTYKKVIDSVVQKNPDVIVVGLTATPVRADATKLGDVFNEVTYHRSMIDLIEAGYLSDLAMKRVELEVSIDNVPRRHGELSSAELRKILTQENVMDAMVGSWKENASPRRTLCFCVDVEHARMLCEAFRKAQVSAEYIHGNTPPDERRDILNRFQEGRFRVLTNCFLLSEGFDDIATQIFEGQYADPLESIMLARPTLSQTLFIQMVGRGVRPGPGKQNCLILDFGYNTKRHALVQLPHLFGFDPLPTVKRKLKDEDEEEKLFPDEFQSVLALLRAAKDVDPKAPPPRAGFRWSRSSFGWALSIGRGNGYLVIRPASEAGADDGNYHVWHYAPPDRDEEDKSPVRSDEYIEHRLTSSPLAWEWAFGLAEDSVRSLFLSRSKGKFPNSIIDKDAGWHDQPPSKAQLDALRKADRVPRTKGDAADMITTMIVERIINSREKATRKQLIYLRRHLIPHHPDKLTKAGASRLISENKANNEQAPDPWKMETYPEYVCPRCSRELYFISERKACKCLACGTKADVIEKAG
jgi:superfamily II DNA or RNA helicase/DNA-directed RNA polymerase subunit RPC12/RpoP